MQEIDGLLNRGWQLHQAGKIAEAEGIYRQALARDPLYSPTWYHLGIVYHDLGRLQESEAAYRRALELVPQHLFALNNLGNLLGRSNRLEEAHECFARAIEIDPAFVLARKNQAFTLYWAGDVQRAIGKLEAALPYAPDDAEMQFNLATMRLLSGDYAAGWAKYEWRWKGGYAALPRIDRHLLWDGSALYGKTILLSSEQGLGDTVQFVRYAQWLKQRYKCRTLFYCVPALLELLSRCAGIDQWVEDGAPAQLPPFDFFTPLTHVPAVLAQVPADFPADGPYVFADPRLIAEWRGRLASYLGKKIGLAWRGADKHPAGIKRAIPPQSLSPLLGLPNFHIFSLQKGAGAEDIQLLAGAIDLGRELDAKTGAFVETAAVLMNLDLLITCDTAIAHVAGALGVPVWLALCHPPDWRWGLAGEQTAWYPTMRLFRQSSPGNWSSVIERMATELAIGNAS